MPVVAVIAIVLVLTFVAWRLYLRAAAPAAPTDTSPFGLTDRFDDRSFVSVPHQKGVRWLTEIFSRSAEQFPDLTALQIPHTGESLTFAELDRRAEEVAAAVSPFLTGPDQVVAVAMSQDNWQIVAAHLGILKAGGTFMFLDTTLPDALISHMLQDARPVVVLTRGVDQFRGLPTLNVLTLPETKSPREPPRWLDDPTQRLAAIFYTSGTTGTPKGVECPHAGYVNLALSYADYFDLLPGMDATSLTSSLGYDGSISEMYSAWVSGCTVVLLTKEQIRSGTDLVAVLREAEVTVLFCPPVLLTTLTATPELDLPYPLCRYIVPAGEAFPIALVEPWTRGRRQIINTYGPTEASTDTSRQSLRPGEPVTIGSPFPNVTYVVLEVGQLRPLPHGEVGELCIGGVHLARGYRNLPEQTAQKFITHPQFGRLYRTGDKCKIDIRTQRVHFLGRIDAQLKVRGHRVEAEAVENILQTQFGEIEAAVLAYQNDSLVAFVVAPSVRNGTGRGRSGAGSVGCAGNGHLVARNSQLPRSRRRIFLVESFVTNPISGKIDRTRLPDLSHLLGNAAPRVGGRRRRHSNRRGIPRRRLDPECEEVLAICRAVFETPLGLDDGFAESGGHSILIARLAQRLRAAGWVVPLRALLGECNTARKVAKRARSTPHGRATPAGPVKADADRAGRDEAAAEVLSIGYFTTLQILFAMCPVFPAFVAILVVADLVDVGAFFEHRSPLDVHDRGAPRLPAGSRHAVRRLALGHAAQARPGWGHLQEQCPPGRVPEVEQDASARLADRTDGEHGARRAGRDVSQRAADLVRLAAARRDGRPQSSMRTGCLALRASGSDLHRGRCLDRDGGLHPHDEVVGAEPAHRPDSPRERLQDRDEGRRRQQRDGGPRHVDHSVHPHPRRRGSS